MVIRLDNLEKAKELKGFIIAKDINAARVGVNGKAFLYPYSLTRIWNGRNWVIKVGRPKEETT